MNNKIDIKTITVNTTSSPILSDFSLIYYLPDIEEKNQYKKTRNMLMNKYSLVYHKNDLDYGIELKIIKNEISQQ